MAPQVVQPTIQFVGAVGAKVAIIDLAEVSDGALKVQQFPGGALNSVPPKQYSILLDGVADIIFTLPGYTGDVFPMTQVVGLPDVCGSAIACTEALLNAREIFYLHG